MKATSILFGLPLLCLACGGDTSSEAPSTSSPELAKQVVGVRTLTPDARYTKPSDYLTEEFVRSNFKIEESVELKETTEPQGIVYSWAGNEVGFTFGNYRPFPTIYAAEAAFDKRYQPEVVAALDALPKKPYTRGGPTSQGLANEWPASPETTGIISEPVAGADSASAVSAVTVSDVAKTLPADSDGKFVAVDGVGDKAVWEPANHTLHVLYNNNVINVMVKTKDSEITQQQRAALLFNVILTEISEQL